MAGKFLILHAGKKSFETELILPTLASSSVQNKCFPAESIVLSADPEFLFNFCIAVLTFQKGMVSLTFLTHRWVKYLKTLGLLLPSMVFEVRVRAWQDH